MVVLSVLLAILLVISLYANYIQHQGINDIGKVLERFQEKNH